METIVPIAFLPEHHALAIAIMSYNGKVEFGLLGDYDAMPDIEDVGRDLEEALAELLAAARERTAPAARANGGEKAGQKRTGKKSQPDGAGAPAPEPREP